MPCLKIHAKICTGALLVLLHPHTLESSPFYIKVGGYALMGWFGMMVSGDILITLVSRG
jgi:hypothetical protein